MSELDMRNPDTWPTWWRRRYRLHTAVGDLWLAIAHGIRWRRLRQAVERLAVRAYWRATVVQEDLREQLPMSRRYRGGPR